MRTFAPSFLAASARIFSAAMPAVGDVDAVVVDQLRRREADRQHGAVGDDASPPSSSSPGLERADSDSIVAFCLASAADFSFSAPGTAPGRPSACRARPAPTAAARAGRSSATRAADRHAASSLRDQVDVRRRIRPRPSQPRTRTVTSTAPERAAGHGVPRKPYAPSAHASIARLPTLDMTAVGRLALWVEVSATAHT